MNLILFLRTQREDILITFLPSQKFFFRKLDDTIILKGHLSYKATWNKCLFNYIFGTQTEDTLNDISTLQMTFVQETYVTIILKDTYLMKPIEMSDYFTIFSPHT